MTEGGGGWRDLFSKFDPRESMAGAWLLAIVVQAAVLSITRTETNGFRGDWAYFLGQVMGASLPIPLILWFAAMRKRDPRGWWKLPLVFLPLTFVLMFGRGIAPPHKEAEFLKASNGISAARERVLEADFGSGKPSGPPSQ